MQCQCTYYCSSYVVSPIAHSLYPVAGNTIYLADDDVSTTLPLNFNFEFYCSVYNQVRICSNGFITFDFTMFPSGGTPYAQSVPSPAVPDAVIAWNWNDLDPSQGGTITYTTIGISPNQKFIVTYSNVPLWSPSNPPGSLRNTGQIVLHESSNLIEIHIVEATNYGWLNQTEGIEDSAGVAGVAVPGRNLSLWTASLSSHMFSPYVIGSPPLLTGDTLLCQGEQGSFSVTPVPGATGYYWNFPGGWSASGSGPNIAAVAGSAGSVSVAATFTCGNSVYTSLGVNVTPAPTIAVVATPSVLCSNTVYTITPLGALVYTVEPGSVSGNTTFTYLPATTTQFTITGAGLNDCLSLDLVTVQAVVKPSPTVSVNSGTICIGGSFSLVPMGASGYTYSSGHPVVIPQSAGLFVYSVTAKGSNGCISAPAVSSVSVAPLPLVSVVADRHQVCANETVILVASGAVSYTWTSLPGNNDTAIGRPALNVTYQVYGTDLNGCRNSGSVSVNVDPCLGIADGLAGVLTVFPNPAENNLFITGISNGSFGLYDLSGRMRISGIFNGDISLDVTALLPGPYILMVTANNQVAVRTVLKE